MPSLHCVGLKSEIYCRPSQAKKPAVEKRDQYYDLYIHDYSLRCLTYRHTNWKTRSRRRGRVSVVCLADGVSAVLPPIMFSPIHKRPCEVERNSRQNYSSAWSKKRRCLSLGPCFGDDGQVTSISCKELEADYSAEDSGSEVCSMAIPKPLRASAIVCAFLFFYLIFQIFRSPPSIHGPGDLEKELPDEPMLEGTCKSMLVYSLFSYLY